MGMRTACFCLSLAAACGSSSGDPCADREHTHVGSFETAQEVHPLEELECIELITGDLVVTSSTVDTLQSLSSLVQVLGDVVIRGRGFDTLAGLESLEEVGGSLRIVDSPRLTSLEGLASLRRIGDELVLSSLSKIESLRGLEHLREVRGDLSITSNEALLDVSALEELQSVGGVLRINSNAALLSAAIPSSGFSAAKGVHIALNDSLEELVDFGELSRDTGICSDTARRSTVFGNPALRTVVINARQLSAPCVEIASSERLTWVRIDSPSLSELSLRSLPALKELALSHLALHSLELRATGLETLDGVIATTACNLSIMHNAQLSSLGSFTGAGGAASLLNISQNPRLPACEVAQLVASLPEPEKLCTDALGLVRAERRIRTMGNDESASCP